MNNKMIINPSIEQLYEDSKHKISDTGAMVAYSGEYTGRSPKDKRIVKNNASKDIWWGNVNKEIDDKLFYFYYIKGLSYLNNISKKTYIIDSYAGWDPENQIKVRTICTDPYHALFMTNMLIPAKKHHSVVDIEILNCSDMYLDELDDELNDIDIIKDSSLHKNLVGIDLEKGKVVIYGTKYAGEMKKAVLTYMMYLMPIQNKLTLHSSACENDEGRVLFFFGLSGTGKTTLSAHPGMNLIGDDEHVWTDNGIFNVEGGCYAKCIGLNPKAEPEIFNSIKYGAVLENVILNNDKSVNFNDMSITHNTRCAYPLHHLENVNIPAYTNNHPNDIILLVCDAFGLLPPVSKLTHKQAVYYFLLGYTCKMPGTEVGVTEPKKTFSTCFAKPFIIWQPEKYGMMLLEKIKKHNCNVWLINTGWIGEKEKKRIPLKYTRKIVDEISKNNMDKYKYNTFPLMNVEIPTNIKDIPENILTPCLSWESQKEYFVKLMELLNEFKEHFIENYGKELYDSLFDKSL